ncbi:MAG: hypothetical protein AAB390_02095 [Patescibacteria group bacterium]|mgnify:FL=1
MTTGEPTEKYETSGLDMGATIEWYRNSDIELPRDHANLENPIENGDLIELTEAELGGLFFLFPENARRRSILRKIVGRSATYFDRDSTGDKPITTNDAKRALSPTAIVPSHIDYTPWTESGTPAADIFLCQIPEDIPEKVRRIIISEGFVHEVGHSIVQPAIFVEEYNLRFPDGRIVSGFDAILQFAEMAENHSPISRYASTYRGENNKFESDQPGYNVNTAISEEMCETIAAYLLGFAYCGIDERSKNPFADRPEIKDFIRDFLNAELVKKQT